MKTGKNLKQKPHRKRNEYIYIYKVKAYNTRRIAHGQMHFVPNQMREAEKKFVVDDNDETNTEEEEHNLRRKRA